MRAALAISICVMIVVGGSAVASSQNSRTTTVSKPDTPSPQPVPVPNLSRPAQNDPNGRLARQLARDQYRCMKNCMGGDGGLSQKVCEHSCF